jgi:AraC-like DNA-binding protein
MAPQMLFLGNESFAHAHTAAKAYASYVEKQGLFRVIECKAFRPTDLFFVRHAAIRLDGVAIVALESDSLLLGFDGRKLPALILAQAGECHLRQGEGLWPLRAGDCLYTRLDKPRLEIKQQSAGILIAIVPERLRQMAEIMCRSVIDAETLEQRLTGELADDNQLPVGRLAAPLAQAIAQVLKLIDQTISTDEALLATLRLDDLVLRLVVHHLVPELRGHAPGQHPEPGITRISQPDLDRLCDWMRANFHQSLAIDDLEQNVHYSSRSLQLAFQRRFGCGPMQWLRQQRLAAAHERLQNPLPTDSVGIIAQAFGYKSLATFSREFRRYYGCKASDLLRQSLRQR